jgi:hypothetical protein
MVHSTFAADQDMTPSPPPACVEPQPRGPLAPPERKFQRCVWSSGVGAVPESRTNVSIMMSPVVSVVSVTFGSETPDPAAETNPSTGVV